MRPLLKIILSAVISISIALYYMVVYNFSLESATNSFLIMMLLFINIIGLFEKKRFVKGSNSEQ